MNMTKVVYQALTQFHHNTKQLDILVIKAETLCNYAPQYNLTLIKT